MSRYHVESLEADVPAYVEWSDSMVRLHLARRAMLEYGIESTWDKMLEALEFKLLGIIAQPLMDKGYVEDNNDPRLGELVAWIFKQERHDAERTVALEFEILFGK